MCIRDSVRTDWLDQLGLERPVTIEDWENYWSLVKTTDLNGNGKDVYKRQLFS